MGFWAMAFCHWRFVPRSEHQTCIYNYAGQVATVIWFFFVFCMLAGMNTNICSFRFIYNIFSWQATSFVHYQSWFMGAAHFFQERPFVLSDQDFLLVKLFTAHQGYYFFTNPWVLKMMTQNTSLAAFTSVSEIGAAQSKCDEP